MIKRGIILCADDFGISSKISAGILDLVKLKRINFVSCLTTPDNWALDGSRIREFSGAVALGLHLALTNIRSSREWPTLSPKEQFSSLAKLLRKSICHQINLQETYHEFSAQFDAFEKVIDSPPRFIDSHHHIHQISPFREIILKIAKERGLLSKVFFRNTYRAESSTSKTLMYHHIKYKWVYRIGKDYRRFLERCNVLTNNGFDGAYPYNKSKNYRKYFSSFLKNICSGGLIMCHPGQEDLGLKEIDTHVEGRVFEYNFFRSQTFLDLLRENNIYLIKPEKVFEVLKKKRHVL